MGKYRSLLSNTLLFAVGTFSSKVLVFLLIPLLTRMLPPEQYSAAKNAIATCNLILPVMYMCISEAIIRFGLDRTYRKSDVFTTGILTVLGGYAVFLCFMPLMRQWGFVDGYVWLVYLYVPASALRTIVTHFVRSGGLVRIFAIDGMFTTVLTVVLVYVFLVRMELGGPGYMLATVCADAVSAVFQILFLRLYRFFRLRGLDRSAFRDMLRYSVPLIPTAVFWWVTNLSDRYFVTEMCGDRLNGLYNISYEIPMVITLVSTIFTQAWQISAFTEYQSAEGEKFYSSVFKSYYTFIFLAASGIIMLIRPVTKILVHEDYYDSWQYVPFLLLAVSFSCLVTFLGTVYNAAKKNGMVTLTTAVGAVVNVILNWILIPKMGPQGAAIATFISFFIVFVIRAVDCQRYIRIRMEPVRILFSLALLLLQSWVSIQNIPNGIWWQILIFAVLTFINFGYLWFLLRRLLEMVGLYSPRK